MKRFKPNGSSFWSARRALISIFISFHCLIIGCQFFPNAASAQAVNDFSNRYVRFFGFEQSYAVFVNPRKTNKHLIGVITYKSGVTELFNYPRVEQYNLIEKIRYERFRKFFSDSLDSDELKNCREDYARYVARTHNRAGDAPYAVALKLITETIVPPNASGHASQVECTPFVTYIVQPADLN